MRRRCKWHKAVRSVMFWRALRVTTACKTHATAAVVRRCASQRAPSIWSKVREPLAAGVR